MVDLDAKIQKLKFRSMEETLKMEKYVKELDDRTENIQKGEKQIKEIDVILSVILKQASWVQDE